MASFQCIYRFLPVVVFKSTFQLKRKTCQGLGSEAAKCKNERPYILLNEICESHSLPKSGSKPDVIKRLVQHYFNDLERVPDYVIEHFPDGEWKKVLKKILCILER